MASLKDLAAQNGINMGRGANMMWFAPEQIYVEPGWNERTWDDPRTEEHLESITQSIIANGYDPTEPIAVKLKKIDGEDRIVLRDGEHRLKAALRAKEQTGRNDILLLAVSLPAGMDEFDELALQARSNSGKPNTPSELANIVKRLKQQKPHLSNAEIAVAINKTRQTVENALSLTEAPIKIQQMVSSGEISATFALGMVKQHGDQAVEILQAKFAEVQAEGKTKITAKHFKDESSAITLERAEPVEVDAPQVEAIAAEADAANTDSVVQAVAVEPESVTSTATDKSTVSDEKPVKRSLKDVLRDAIESAEYGESNTRQWVGFEFELWQELIQFAGVKNDTKES